jgi:hypothetical protein
VRFPAELVIFLFTTASRPALGPTQPPIQLAQGALSLGVKRPWREAEHTPPSSADFKNTWSYTATPPVRLHGMVLSWSTGTILPLPLNLPLSPPPISQNIILRRLSSLG